MCESDCTGQILPYCCVGIVDFGEPMCMNCGVMFTKKGLEKELMDRYGEMWPFKLDEFKYFRKDVKLKTRRLRKSGHLMGETIYYIDPPVNPELHEDHMSRPGEHVKKKKSKATQHGFSLMEHA